MEKCIICGMPFKNSGELSKHLNKKHDGAESYYILNLKKERGKCKICGNYSKFINIQSGYKNTCGQKQCLNLYIKIKREETFLKKYGVKTPAEIKGVKEKIGESNKKKAREALEKRKITNLNKFGVENPYQSLEIREKIKKTNLKKYGDEIPQKTKEIKEKTEKTNFKKYKGKSPQSDPLIFEKSQNTKIQKYGNKNYNNPKQTQKTLLDLTGYEHALQNPDSRKKFRETSLDRFGENHPMQNEKIFNKSIKSGFRSKKYKDSTIYYQGAYEFDFLEKFYDKIDSLTKGPRIEYYIDCKKHYYFPDFYVPSRNLIIEIKSKYWNKKHLELNKIKKEACLERGYDYILIEDLKYASFLKLLE